jgi:L-fucose isomerase
MIVATENDSKNAIGMLAAQLLSGMPQLFADIRTNWTPESVRKATGKDIRKVAPGGFIDKRNSGAGALDYGVDIFAVAGMDRSAPISEVSEAIRSSARVQKELIETIIEHSEYKPATLEYFPGDGLSSHYRTPGGIPMTAYRYNVVDNLVTCSVVEGGTVELPVSVADHVSAVTDKTWPESYWVPRGMTSFEYMSRMGPNHDANSFGLIGADLLTLNAMLRVPVDLHNVPASDIFRPTMWDRFGGDDFRACAFLGPMYT